VSTEQPNQTPETPQDKARGDVLMAMFFQGKLNDEILPADKMEIFNSKTFPEWPVELQDKLRPFGAEMIQ
jgi:hypothetical protein